MIHLDYNIFLELAVIPLDIVLLIYLVMRYTNPTRVNIAFRRFALFVTITDIVDVATAVVTSAHALVPNAVHYLFNIADSALAAITGFLFIYYIYAYSSMDERDLKRRKIFNATLLSIDLLLLATNPFTGLVFTYDTEGNYIHQMLFTPVAYGFPILFFAIGSIYMATHRERYRRSQLTTMLLAIIISGILFLLQMLFFDDVLLTFFIASIGCLVIFLSLESPEHDRLVQATAELKEARAREAAAEAQERLSQEVMLALSKAVDAKDHYTNGHSERVAKYAREIAKRMGKTEKEQTEIYELGLLHDIGKIGIAEEIINKKGKLTREEFAEIRKHTVIGWEILKTITEIPWLSKGARWHHERFDGKGYPDGLCGREIPEEARIICLADSYDAMTSKRSYSSPRAQQEVRDEIVRCSGTQFDPEIAGHLLAMIDEDQTYLLREQT
ncbi:MAG: HD-GYP domain-containing protein [Lachnospiraceae bacterium]|nr:HD-GYP domain-containing protein [Lachnospiraceae bacterium]